MEAIARAQLMHAVNGLTVYSSSCPLCGGGGRAEAGGAGHRRFYTPLATPFMLVWSMFSDFIS